MQTEFIFETGGQGLSEITRPIAEFVSAESSADTGAGLLTLFLRHTSCSLLIQENADPDVRRDLDQFFRRLVPDAGDPSMAWLTHLVEGPDDMPAHIKAAVLPVSLSIPCMKGRMQLGTWQGIYLFEHRRAAHRRRIVAHLSR